MMDVDSYAREVLQQELERRKTKNDSYSMRALARDLKISPSYLWDFLSGRRAVSEKMAVRIAEALHLSGEQKDSFIISSQLRADEQEKSFELFQLMSYWHHFAILNLSRHPQNQADPAWIADRLLIDESKAKAALDLLQEMHLIKVENGKMQVQKNRMRQQIKIPHVFFYKHHKSLMNQAAVSFANLPRQSMEMRSMLLPIDPERIDEARELLLNVRDKIISRFTHSGRSFPYVLSYYLFPMNQDKSLLINSSSS